MRLLVSISLFVFLLNTLIQAAAMRHLSPLINIPIAQTYDAGQLEYSTLLAFTKNEKYDFDAMLNYTITDRIKIGLAMMTPSTFAANIHTTFVDNGHFGVAGGIRNISSDKNIPGMDDYPITQTNHFSPYITSYYGWERFKFHLGFGGQGFQRTDIDKLYNGLFCAFDLTLFNGNLILEYDAKDINFGYKLHASNNTDITFAITELTSLKKTNPNYNDAPTRFISLGFTIRQNVHSQYRAQQKALRKAQEDTNALQSKLTHLMDQFQLELTRLENTKLVLQKDVESFKLKVDDYLNRHFVKNTPASENILIDPKEEQVMSLYSKSFDAYSKNDLQTAIKLISDAINLDPKNALLYTRLGSYYYKLGLIDIALDTWEVALELDPNNDELKKLLYSQ